MNLRAFNSRYMHMSPFFLEEKLTAEVSYLDSIKEFYLRKVFFLVKSTRIDALNNYFFINLKNNNKDLRWLN